MHFLKRRDETERSKVADFTEELIALHCLWTTLGKFLHSKIEQSVPCASRLESITSGIEQYGRGQTTQLSRLIFLYFLK